MKLKNHGLGSSGQVFQGDVVKKEPNLFLREKSLDEVKYLGVGFFEWLAVLGVFCVIFSTIIKNF